MREDLRLKLNPSASISVSADSESITYSLTIFWRGPYTRSDVELVAEVHEYLPIYLMAWGATHKTV